MDGNGVTRIGDASKLFAWTLVLVAGFFFDDATFSATARIRTAVGFFALAVQTRTRATVVAFFPFVLAAVFWFLQCEFGAGWSSTAAIVAFVQRHEVVLIATAAGIIEWDALTASDVVGPATMVIMASTVIDSLAAAFFIVSTAMGVDRSQISQSDDGEQEDDQVRHSQMIDGVDC